MKLILPVFPHTTLERQLLNRGSSTQHVIVEELTAFLYECTCDVIVLTDHSVVYDALRHIPVSVVFTDNPPGNSSSSDHVLPNGSVFAVETALAKHLIEPTDMIVILDYQGPCLNDFIWKEASELFRNNQSKALFGVSEPLNHPVQCFSRNLMESDLITVLVFMEDPHQATMSDQCDMPGVTRPFPFNQIMPGFTESFARQVDLSDEKNHMLADLKKKDLFENSEFYHIGESWYSQDDIGWRRLNLSAADLELPVDRTFAAVDLFGPLYSQFICLKDVSNRICILYSRVEEFDRGVFPIVYVFMNQDFLCRIPLTETESHYLNDNFRVVGEFVMPDNAWGIAIFSMIPAERNDTKQTTPLELSPALWTTGEDHIRRDIETHAGILGRQDFPDLLEIDLSIALFQAVHLNDLYTFLNNHQCIGFRTPEAVFSIRRLPRLALRADCGDLSGYRAVKERTPVFGVKRDLDTLKPFILYAQTMSYIKNLKKGFDRDDDLIQLEEGLKHLEFSIVSSINELSERLSEKSNFNETICFLKKNDSIQFIGYCIPSTSSLFWQIVHALRSHGRHRETIELLKSIRIQERMFWAIDLQLGQSYGLTGQFKKALCHAVLAKHKNPDGPYVDLHIGVALYRLNRLKKAADHFDKVLAGMNDNVMARIYQAVTCYGLHDIRNSLLNVSGLVPDDQDQMDMHDRLTRHFNLYIVCICHIYSTCWMLDRYTSDLLINQDGSDCLGIHLPSLCLAVASGAAPVSDVQSYPFTHHNHIDHASQLRIEGKIDESQAYCKTTFSHPDEIYKRSIHMGMNFHSMGFYERALEQFDQVEERLGFNEWLVYMKSVCLFELGKYDDVLALTVSMRHPSTQIAFDIVRAGCFWESDLLEDSKNTLIKAITDFGHSLH